MPTQYETKEDVLAVAEAAVHRTLREIIPVTRIPEVEADIIRYATSRKGHFGDLVEQYVFGIENNSRSEADFNIAGVELKTTPIKKHPKKRFVAKERLVFSMINYDKIIEEEWETSSFLKKNSVLMLLFYLYLQGQSPLDYEFEFAHLLNLLEDLSIEDAAQIRQDWETIVAKIRRGEAHLLSEGDTFYLGACTKAKNSSVVRDQPRSRVPAKPRAFSLKQTYLNYLIQKKLLGKDVDSDSIYKSAPKSKTLEEVVQDKFKKYIGKTDKQIMREIGWQTTAQPKSYKRLLVNRVLTGTGSNKIEELEKANVTMKVVTLESSGTLKESISFPAFDYKDLVTQVWYDEDSERMSDFHAALEMKKFLFIVFQKIKGSDDIVLKKAVFWNFPMADLDEAERVFDRTIACINEGRYEDLPKMTESNVAHVRPHGADSNDTIETPQGTQEMKKSFWLNARYIQTALEQA